MAIEEIEDAQTPEAVEAAVKKAKAVDRAGQTIVSAAVTMLDAAKFREEVTGEASIPRQLCPKRPSAARIGPGR